MSSDPTIVITPPVVVTVVVTPPTSSAPTIVITPPPAVVVVVSQSATAHSFETVSKNLAGHPFTLGRTGALLTSIVYGTPAGNVIKSFAYNLGLLTTITLSGVLPIGIKTVKTLNYDSGGLTGATYS